RRPRRAVHVHARPARRPLTTDRGSLPPRRTRRGHEPMRGETGRAAWPPAGRDAAEWHRPARGAALPPRRASRLTSWGLPLRGRPARPPGPARLMRRRVLSTVSASRRADRAEVVAGLAMPHG